MAHRESDFSMNVFNESHNNRATDFDLSSACIEHMRSNGLDFPGTIIADGKIQRFSADRNQNKRDEWYIAYQGISQLGKNFLICSYGSWSTGEKFVFKSWEHQPSLFSDQERAGLSGFLNQHVVDANAELLKVHEEAVQKAQKIWQSSTDKPPSEEFLRYTALKGIEPIGVKFGSYGQSISAMIIPLQSIDGSIRSLQFIYMNQEGKSEKRFLSGGEKRGNFFVLGELADAQAIFVTEGYATGVSVYSATHQTTVVAFDAGNIEPVIENLKKKYPKLSITIAGDDDETGRAKAGDAAKHNGCHVVFPGLTKYAVEGKKYNDFNDLHQVAGLDEVKKQLNNVRYIPSLQEELKNAPPQKEDDPCADFSIDALPPILGDYISALSKTTNAHPLMIACSVYAMASAFIKKRVHTPYFQTLYPNLWLLSITRSGQFKSTALNKGSKLAVDWSKRINAEIRELKNTQDEHSQQENTKEIEDLAREDVLLPQKITPEALIVLLSKGQGGTIFHNEFGGFLKAMEQQQNSDLKALYTDLFDVNPIYRYTTKNNGDFVLEEPFISFCAMSTLTWLKGSIKDSDIFGGFLARFLIFTPQYHDDIPPALPELMVSSDDSAEKAVQDVLLQAKMRTIEYKLSAAARRLFEKDHNDIYTIAKSYEMEELLPFVKRWSPYILKLAMINQLFLDPETNEISEQAIKGAMALIMPAIKSTVHLFAGELGESEHQQSCRKVLDFICMKAKKKDAAVTRPDLLRSNVLKGGAKAYDSVLETLEQAGRVEVTQSVKKKNLSYMPIVS